MGGIPRITSYNVCYTKLLRTEQFIKNVVNCPNPEDNGGESVLFTTTVITDEDVVCLESEIMLMSYGNCCAMTLGSANLSPKFLV